jgi:DNA polymerase (family 10)
MTNAEIADVLLQISILLDIKGEDFNKVRAYQLASDVIANLPEPISAIRDRGELLRVPRVGKSIGAKIEELLDTGRLQYYEDLRGDFPPAALGMLKIPGIGPKTIKQLIAAGVTSPEELEAAAREGRLRGLPGMGEKTEAEILRGIGQLREFGTRATLGVAWDLAQRIMGALRDSAPVDQMEAAGSLRRSKESIGDVDVLVTSDDPRQVMDRFVHLDLVRSIISHGPTRSSVITDAGMQADVRVVAPESFGAALQYFTGSKEHNIALREMGVKQHIKLNEYGVFRVTTEGEERIGGRTEEEMYAAVGLAWIPPELRENDGELEAARTGRLPDLIEPSDIRGDLQMHSTWSDGHNSIEEMARAAKGLGYQYVAITDHSPAQKVANGLSVTRLRERQEEIEAARRAVPGITILSGTEVDIRRDGSLDYPDEVLAELDFVIASVHSGWKTPRQAMTDRVLRALENPWVDALGHPTGRLIGRREPFDIDLEQVLKAAAGQGVAVEINAYPDRLDLRDVSARLAVSLGVKLLINTDAHDAGALPYMRFGVATARRGWVSAKDVLNTLPAGKLLRSLRRAKHHHKAA